MGASAAGGLGAFILLKSKIRTPNKDRAAVGQYRKYLIAAAQAIVSVCVLAAIAIWVGPSKSMASIMAMQLVAVAALPFVLFPSWFFVVWDRISHWFGGLGGVVSRVRLVRVAARIERALAGIGELMRARPTNVAAILLLGVLPAAI